MSASAARAFELIDRVATAGARGVTLAELATEMPLAKSTTHRYVTTLLNLGVLRRDPTGRLLLGLKLVELADSLPSADDLCCAGEPVMHDLVARTGETVHLGVGDDGHVVYLAKAESPHSVRLVSQVGARVPMHCTAMGKALLASLDSEDLHRVLAQSRAARTEHTIISGGALLTELEQVRARGAAIDDRGERARCALCRRSDQWTRRHAARCDQRVCAGEPDDPRTLRRADPHRPRSGRRSGRGVRPCPAISNELR